VQGALHGATLDHHPRDLAVVDLADELRVEASRAAVAGRLPKLLNTVISTTAMMTQRSMFLAMSFNAL
jgi:hypothetical protein